jgi:hypothetical protein
VATPLSEWCVSWPSDESLRQELKNSTLYVTLEPSAARQGYVCCCCVGQVCISKRVHLSHGLYFLNINGIELPFHPLRN